MARHSQDIPIRPRYGYLESSNEDETADEETRRRRNTERAQKTSCTSSSYSEIPFLAQYVGTVPKDEGTTTTITTLKEPTIENDDDDDDDCDTDEEDNTNSKDSNSGEQSKTHKRPNSLHCDSTFPYELEGATSSTGEMRHFVAHNLEEKLRESNQDYSLASDQTTPSMSNAPGALTRRFLQSNNIPEIDGNVLSDIELETQYLAASVDNLTENLGNLLHSISSITADNVEVHKNAVNKLTDSMDANIKCMYTIMAKTEEITKSMRSTEQLGQRIREIKRLVDMLDNTM